MKKRHHYLPQCYLKGFGTTENQAKGEKYLLKSAMKGYGDAFVGLARELKNGKERMESIINKHLTSPNSIPFHIAFKALAGFSKRPIPGYKAGLK